MGSPIRSGYPNTDRKTRPGYIRGRDGIYDCVFCVFHDLDRRIRCEFHPAAIVISKTVDRGLDQCAGKTLRDVECDPK